MDSLDEMVDKILEAYEVDEKTARADAVRFIGQLVQNGFIVCTKEDHTW